VELATKITTGYALRTGCYTGRHRGSWWNWWLALPCLCWPNRRTRT